MRPAKMKPRPRNLDETDANRLMLAYLCIATEGREASLIRKVGILMRFGLTNQEIARVCGATSQSVADAKVEAKRLKR
jgi:hypothetical protein